MSLLARLRSAHPRTAAELAALLEAAIRDGSITPGSTLPPIRALAAELALAPNTTASAYRQLRTRGLIAGRGRQGSTVALPARITPAPSITAVPNGLIDAMSGNPHPDLLPSLSEHLPHIEPNDPHGRYGGALLIPELAERLVTWLEADGVPASHLTLSSGAMDGVERVLSLHQRVGDRVAVEDPGHGPVISIVRALGLEPVPVAVDDQGPTPEGLRRALRDGIQALVMTPRAQNPMGSALNAERAEQLMRLLHPHRHILVIEDDHAGPISGAPFIGLDHSRPRWAVIRSVAKSLGPDLRVAVIAGDSDTIAAVEARFIAGPGWVSTILQRIVASMLSDSSTTERWHQAAAHYTQRRQWATDHLEDLGFRGHCASGMHVWIPVADEQHALHAAAAAGFAIRVGQSYRLRTPPAVRITLSHLDQAQIITVLDAITDRASQGRSPLA